MMNKQVVDFIKQKLSLASDGDILASINLVDGKSGAEVYYIKVHSRRPRFSGPYIVKLIDINNPWYSQSSNEATKAADIYSAAPYYNSHLVKSIANGITESYHIIIYSYANDSVSNTSALGKLDVPEKLKYLELISYELLALFNDDVQTVSSCADFFSTLLTYRLDDEGNFKKRLTATIEDTSSPAIIINRNIYPSPLYYLELLKTWEAAEGTILFRGNTHGDLHPQNILCAKSAENITESVYSIIDYDSYSNSGYLFFDHAYLELSLILQEISGNDLKQWEDAVSSIATYDFKTPIQLDSHNLAIQYRNAICAGISQWYHNSYHGLGDDINIQYSMARVAAGINYFSKSGINNDVFLAKMLLYITVNLKQLFSLTNTSWNPAPASRLHFAFSKDETIDEMWENCGKFQEGYVKILLTDGTYDSSDFADMEGLTRVEWSFVIDISTPNTSKNLERYFTNIVGERRNLIRCLSDSNTKEKDYTPGTCLWLLAQKMPEILTYTSLWKDHQQQKIKNVIKTIKGYHPFSPFLLVIDCMHGFVFAQKFFTYLDDGGHMPAGTRIINLRKDNIFNEDERLDMNEKYKLFIHPGSSLMNIAAAAERYISDNSSLAHSGVVLPALTHLDGTVTEKEMTHFETSVELVYSGIERKSNDMDFGKNFFQGEEIQWHDLAFHIDIPLYEEDHYRDKLSDVIKAIDEDSPRVRIRQLAHSAGTGGTTLSKRLLWDIKGRFPSMRLKRYTTDTAKILLEIYRKTGKCLFITLESGSSVIETSDLKKLIEDVNADNGRAFFLQVSRSEHHAGDNDAATQLGKPIISLKPTMQWPVAQSFFQKFSKMSEDMPQAHARKELLKNITNSNRNEWIEQRCPFFYGFYTFQDQYDLSTIEHTISNCTQYERDFLSDLAFLTEFSQNLCVRYDELSIRFGHENEVKSPQLLHETIPDSIRKLIVRREDGWRICHKLIARKILKSIYSADDISDCIYSAASGYVQRIYKLYGENSLVDSVFKELLIDRTSVDGEKAKFSAVIQMIPKLVEKKNLFEKMKDLYPQNPHYYNHLARLLSYEKPFEYDKAENLLIDAIRIATEPSIHQTTLGCVYTKKLLSELSDRRKAIKDAKRLGWRSDEVDDIVTDVKALYGRADGAFSEARESSLGLDSFSFFPNIKMECDFIEYIVACDKHNRSLNLLIENEPAIKDFYFEHYSKATQLLAEMKEKCGENDKFFTAAKALVESKSNDDIHMERRLKECAGDYSNTALFIRRTYAGGIFSHNNCSWDNLQADSLRLINESMRLNIFNSSKIDHIQTDLRFWFETYRRLPEFDSSEAIRFISDYKKDGYEKDYLLLILNFLRYEKNLSSRADVKECISRCTAQIPPGINTAAFKDAYSATLSSGCPIIPMGSVKREEDSIVGLKKFTGSILSVDGTRKGHILLDNLALEVTFLPSITDATGRERRFTSNDHNDPVEFNLMFSYSGLRAWDVEKRKI